MAAGRWERTREWFFRMVVRRPRTVLAVILALTLAFAWRATGVEPNRSATATRARHA